MSFSIDRAYLIETLQDLVRINSVNPSLVPDAPGEAEIAALVAVRLREMGLSVEILESVPGRPSVVGTLKGSGRGPSLMLNAHTDTVGGEGMVDPFSPRIRDGKMYGRGAYDMKGSLASCLAAAKSLVDAGAPLAGNLVLAAVADEEFASLGTSELLERCRVEAAIVTEPTDLQVCLAHKGFAWLEVETRGKAAHGSRFQEGIDANLHMGRVLAELERLEQTVRQGPAHPLLGPPSLHAARIRGGTALSVYAERCRLQIERRTLPGESEPQVLGEVRAILERLSDADPRFQAKARLLLARPPFEVSPETPIVQCLCATVEQVLGKRPRLVGQTPWMDAALLAQAGVQTVVIGPGGGGAHSAEEWVMLESLFQLAEILARSALAYCGSPGR